MKIKRDFTLITVCLFAIALRGQDNLLAHYGFDDIREERKIVEMVRGETFVPKEVFAYVKEELSGKEYDLNGKYYKVVKGVNGNAALLDGYTAYIEIDGEDNDNIPVVKDEFTIETWIALGAYPKNYCPLFSHRRDVADGYYKGYSLEIDALGRPSLFVATRGRNAIAMSDKTIPLNKWTHIAATYSKEMGLSLYVDGVKMASEKPMEAFQPADTDVTTLLIGKSRSETRPFGTIRPEGTERSFTFFDGIIDELKLHKVALDEKTIAKAFKKDKTIEAPELPERILPSGPKSPKIFRAVNTSLKYYEGWDAPWAIDKSADIVVQFDEADCKFVFWHGTSYIPNWVTENNFWFNNGFNEGWNNHGSCEPMSDKKSKYSTVKIVESTPARVVVQWRYALVDVVGTFAFEDPTTGWGDWTNETFTIYPDMVGVREDKLLSNAPHAAHEWQESIMVMGPGQSPEDVLEYAALSLANDKGETETYSWEHETPPFLPPSPKSPTIQIVNTKSEYKPFSILRPQDDPKIDVYAGEIRRDVSVFPWWNHWPVAPRPTDGRYAQFSDRASHASLSHWLWNAYKSTDRSLTKVMLNGLTNKPIEELQSLAKSWSNPAKIVFGTAGNKGHYVTEERAYHIEVGDAYNDLSFALKGTNETPIENPAFVVKNWGEGNPIISINGSPQSMGKDLRYGFVDSLESRDLILWIRLKDTKDVSIKLEHKKAN
ncbi:MAG: LamG domain-containing protein [Bacteroidota bacterium]